MCRQNYKYSALPAGAWIDSSPAEDKPEVSSDSDMSYWSELGMCYQPEWFPLGGTLLTSE